MITRTENTYFVLVATNIQIFTNINKYLQISFNILYKLDDNIFPWSIDNAYNIRDSYEKFNNIKENYTRSVSHSFRKKSNQSTNRGLVFLLVFLFVSFS